MAAMKPEDSLDIDRFLNLDGAYSPASSASRGKGIATPEYKPQIVNTNTFAPLQQGSQAFAGPSHQYGLHKQHIPLPPGALANSLAAAQRPTFAYNGYQQELGMGSNTGLYDMNTNEDFFDFNTPQAHNPPFSGSNDVDMEFDSPVEGVFVDPNALGGQEDDSPAPTPAEVVRAYPGMHVHKAQQAALAKQQQQLEIQRQQQQRASQRPSNASSHKPSPSRSGGSRPPMDPAVEERISRLLSQMRQSSEGSSDDQTPKPTGSSTLQRAKKDEEDMDEDERLLASEEGKKLSSKERRQLRNKVSARAFRSRRKEYIGQLEGEVAVKSTEADNLRAENEALKAENSRLTDLSKLLLSSPAFSTFLNDLSANGLPPSIGQGPTPQAPTQQQSLPQEAVPQQQQYQMQHHNNGMASIPETQLDFNSVDSMNSNWNVGIDFNFHPQIFAVTELPETPSIETLDVGVLSGKSDASFSSESFSENKMTMPSIETPRSLENEESTIIQSEDSEAEDRDSEFDLFAYTPSTPRATAPAYQVFGNIDFQKAVERFDIIAEDESSSHDGIVSASTMLRFESICASLDSLSESLARMTV